MKPKNAIAKRKWNHIPNALIKFLTPFQHVVEYYDAIFWIACERRWWVTADILYFIRSHMGKRFLYRSTARASRTVTWQRHLEFRAYLFLLHLFVQFGRILTMYTIVGRVPISQMQAMHCQHDREIMCLKMMAYSWCKCIICGSVGFNWMRSHSI